LKSKSKITILKIEINKKSLKIIDLKSCTISNQMILNRSHDCTFIMVAGSGGH